MKPLSVWMESELRDRILYPSAVGHDGCDDRFVVLEELLRRAREEMRERCIEAVRQVACVYDDGLWLPIGKLRGLK